MLYWGLIDAKIRAILTKIYLCSFNSDSANVDSGNQPENENQNCGKVALSDSMIPLVGDSILERNEEV